MYVVAEAISHGCLRASRLSPYLLTYPALLPPVELVGQQVDPDFALRNLLGARLVLGCSACCLDHRFELRVPALLAHPAM